jgi:magnesium chelatase family protein
MNPCPCGYADDPERMCAQCTGQRAARYQQRVSGPLRDRIDVQIEVPALPQSDLVDGLQANNEDSAAVRTRVIAAWQRQIDRQQVPNARLTQDGLRRHCRITPAGEALLNTAIGRLGLSARAFHRILRVARTIADLDAAERIGEAHLTEAIGYRRLDRGFGQG